MKSANKVAKITFAFWVMKIIATTLGETSGDLLSMTLDLGYTLSLAITMLFLLFALFLQLKSRAFHPVFYWAVIVGTTSAGTEVSDLMDRTLGLGYMVGSAILVSGLLTVLALWYYREKSLSVFPITKIRVEAFYWIAVLFSNSLGTAFGDFLSDTAGLSYTGGAMVTAAIIAIVILVHRFTKINSILLFWIAFVFTRPFGATFGDLLTKPLSKGGLNLGTIPASLVSASLLTLLVIFTTIQIRNKNKTELITASQTLQ